MAESMTPVALSIAGSDSGAGAGAQADLLTFAANGVFGTTALTCLTAQNPGGVSGVLPVPAAFVLAQCEQVRAHFHPKAAKTGMLLQADAIEAMRTELIPLAAVVTPTLDEASLLLGRKTEGGAQAGAEALELARRHGVPFLVKGGHGTGDRLVDALAWPDGRTVEMVSARVPGIDTHGSGCTLSAAIAAGLARGKDLEEAVREAHAYLQKALRNPLPVAGLRCIRHI
ncbi:MAG: hydroxymethylpyrimidine/phosphomethylpyrimidine kinase [Opitutia bacterium]